jgi:DNA-binding transcriptional regulator YiaG
MTERFDQATWDAETVRAARQRLGLSCAELAKALKLSAAKGKDTVREWENGRREISGPAQAAMELMLRSVK